MYRIKWKIIDTGYEGHGEWFKNEHKEMLISNVEYYNIQYKDVILHKIEKKV